MWELIESGFKQGLGAYIVIVSLFTGFLCGLFYKHKIFATREYVNAHAYSKQETESHINETTKILVTKEIFQSKLESIDLKLEYVTASLNKVELLLSKLIK